jgi:porin
MSKALSSWFFQHPISRSAASLGFLTLGLILVDTIAVDSAWGQVAKEVLSQPSLPMPQHPERKPENAEITRPPESQPDRESRPTVFTQLRTNSNMPIPGRPSRNLPPLGEPEESSEPSSAPEAIEAFEEAGLFKSLPHQWRDGGITFEYIYTGESFTKTRGGITSRRPTNYRSNLDLVAIVDTEKMGWWENGRLFVYGQNLSGRPLSAEEVGDVQLFSNLDSTISETERPHFTTIAEYWYEHLLLEQRLRIKIGKQDTNADFALCDLGGDFVNSSFGLPPMIPLPTFPSQALGIATFFQLTEEATLGIGAFDGTLPSGPQGVRWGFDTLGHHGAITLYQLEWKPSWGGSELFPTTVRTGMWHHSDKDVWTELTADPNPRTFAQNYGTWTTADQIIWKESECPGNDQGLGIFGQFGWAPGNRNLIQEYYGGGLVYKGFLPGRDEDLIGLAFANAIFGSGIRAQQAATGDAMKSNETATELFYKYQYSPFISIQPDLQYIANPGGLFRDALLAGLRFEVVF